MTSEGQLDVVTGWLHPEGEGGGEGAMRAVVQHRYGPNEALRSAKGSVVSPRCRCGPPPRAWRVVHDVRADVIHPHHVTPTGTTP
jgi:hypothetical protein